MARMFRLSAPLVLCLLALILSILFFPGCNLVPTTQTTPPGPLASYALSVSVVPAGSGTVSPPGGKYDSGLQVSLTATPTAGYEFDYWEGSLAGSSSKATITMSSDKTVAAHFKLTGVSTTTNKPTTTTTTAPSIPDIIGSWQGTMDITDRPFGGNPAGHFTWAINSQSGASFSGTFNITFGSTSWTTMAISGQFTSNNQIYVSYAVPRSATSWSFNGNVQGDQINGTWSGTGSCAYAGDWQASRLGGTSTTRTIPKLGQ
ncbi:MAG TPA: hypothetical protein VMB24_00660 [Dehalococcoidales bacterium]|nr:hypothetical protein [Dehalococcoidales bacterium]